MRRCDARIAVTRRTFDDVRGPRDPQLRLSARLSFHLCLGSRGVGREAHRRGARGGGEQLHPRRRLRQGRPLRRAHPPPGAPHNPAAAYRPEGLRSVSADRLGGGAGPGRGSVHRDRPQARCRGGLALLLRGHDGPCAARRDQSPAPRHALCPAEENDLHGDLRGRLDRRRRAIHRSRPARNGEIRPDRRLGRQSRRDPGERDGTHHPRSQGAWGEARRGRSVPDRHGAGGRPPSRASPGHGRRAGLRRHAYRVSGRICRPRLHGAIRRLPRRAGDASAIARTGMGQQDYRAFGGGDRGIRQALLRHGAQLYPHGIRVFPLPQRRGESVRGELPADGHGRLAP